MRNSAWVVALTCALTIWVLSTFASAQTETTSPAAGHFGAESPRHTFETFLNLRTELRDALEQYEAKRNATNARRPGLLLEEVIGLFDLSDIALAARPEAGLTAALSTLDLLERLEPVDLAALPGLAGDLDAMPASVRVPGTPIRLTRVENGVQRGQYLFDANTLQTVLRELRVLEIIETDAIVATPWSDRFSNLTGHLLPASIATSVPPALHEELKGTPLWKVVLLAMVAFVLVLSVALTKRLKLPVERSRLVIGLIWRARVPLAGLAALALFFWIARFQINVSGPFALSLAGIQTLSNAVLLAWMLWIMVHGVVDLIASRQGEMPSIDVNLIHLSGRIAALFAVIFVLATGAQALGLPVFSILAGLGIGGLAIALAIRPTFENLIGGFILYIDRPIRVGDFCSFGTLAGTVEQIGVRSTQVRALDRTLITVPNAQFADMQIINWAQCDMMLIKHRVGVRFETDPDTLRYVLAQLRRMFHAHPRIDNDTIRVRFVGLGDASQDLEIRVYALTREWNDFFAIQEDVLLRIAETVRAAGSDFAFPSQTMYMARDTAPNEAAADHARKQVSLWRHRRQLPFPTFSPDEIAEMEDTLAYPPLGSPDNRASEPDGVLPGSEPLSTEPPGAINETREEETRPGPASKLAASSTSSSSRTSEAAASDADRRA
ncbi:MAG: mechanosensitive ion channel family protein [Pseudomonadota bacterium]